MDPGVRLGEALAAVEHQECQGVIGVVAVLGQERSTELALHRNQTKRRLSLVTLQPPYPTATEVTEAIKNNYAALGFHCLLPVCALLFLLESRAKSPEEADGCSNNRRNHDDAGEPGHLFSQAESQLSSPPAEDVETEPAWPAASATGHRAQTPPRPT
jgi:hypothetical protein